jgi:hypothetical protein
MKKRSFLADTFTELASIPRLAWLLMLGGGIVGGGADFLDWQSGKTLSSMDWMALGLTLPVEFAAIYVATMSLISRESSLAGFLKFVTSTILLTLPIVIGLGGILLFADHGRVWVIWTFTPLLVLGWLFVTMMPALPVAQALSSRFVSPLKILRETKGHRWDLFVASTVSGALNKLVPESSTARNWGEAALLALGNQMVAIVTSLFLACIAVTAWRYGCESARVLPYTEIPTAGS